VFLNATQYVTPIKNYQPLSPWTMVTPKGGAACKSQTGGWVVSLTTNCGMKKNDPLHIRKFEHKSVDLDQIYAISAWASKKKMMRANQKNSISVAHEHYMSPHVCPSSACTFILPHPSSLFPPPLSSTDQSYSPTSQATLPVAYQIIRAKDLWITHIALANC